MNDIMYNSLDGVSDRDYAIELATDLAMIMKHLSRLSEEIILWCSWEFKYIELDDAYATGSSIMPQKKNPDIAELVRGKSARVINDVSTLLDVYKRQYIDFFFNKVKISNLDLSLKTFKKYSNFCCSLRDS